MLISFGGKMQQKDGHHYRKRKLKSGIVWEVLLEGKWKSTSQAQIQAAMFWTKKYLSRAHSQKFAEFASGFFEVGSFYYQLQEAKGRKRSTAYYPSQQGRLNNYILPYFGDMLISDINVKMIDNFLLGVQTGNNTKNKILNVLRIILDAAVREELISTNPARLVQPFNEDNSERQPFTQEELGRLFPDDKAQLIQVWGDLMWACYFAMLRDTGHRPGEQSALLWSDLWQQEGRFGCIIDKALDAVTKQAKPTTKTGYARATLVSPETYALLQEWRASALFCDDTDLIFTLDGQRGLINDTIAKHLRSAAQGIALDLDGRTPYCFRHTFNTQLLLKYQPAQVRFLMGHRSEKETDHYNHPDRRLLIQKAVSI